MILAVPATGTSTDSISRVSAIEEAEAGEGPQDTGAGSAARPDRGRLSGGLAPQAEHQQTLSGAG
jgi:hypothetical protein